jgi:hypothetical protein
MNMTVTLSILLLGAAVLSAQAPQSKTPPADKNAAAPAAAPAATDNKPPKTRAQPARQAEAEDEGTVLIDSKGETEDAGRYAPGSEQAQADVPGGIPSSYGQCKGVINDAGRSVLVFENSEDGAVVFVQIFFGKGGVSWKLVDKIGRSAD